MVYDHHNPEFNEDVFIEEMAYNADLRHDSRYDAQFIHNKKEMSLMTKEMLKRISDALDWYEGTDGSERETAANNMYAILTDIYNENIIK